MTLSIRFASGLEVIDQTLLPHEEVWRKVDSPETMIQLIKCLAVRGAPLIGVAAAMALGDYAKGKTREQIVKAALALREARPTAVNLMHAMDRMLSALDTGKNLWNEAVEIYNEDVALCDAMAERGAKYINDGDGIITHCNTGALATAGAGTALAVIKKAHAQGKKIHVYVDETRPLLQGARLTAWELEKSGIPYTLICDNMAASLMKTGKVHKAFVGSDRIAVNGDAANKIGTYGLAVICKYHNVPFYVVAPSTTYDAKCATGDLIPIEERNADEVRAGKSPKNAKVWNPAFDVTPKALIAKVILEDREF